MGGETDRRSRFLRTSALVMLAVSPFVAYVLFLPQSEPAPDPLEPSSIASTPQATPTPLFTPSPILAPEPEPLDEPVQEAAGAAPVSPQRTTSRPRTGGPPVPPAEPAPTSQTQEEPAPQSEDPPQEDPPPAPEPPSGDADNCWPVCGDPAAQQNKDNNDADDSGNPEVEED